MIKKIKKHYKKSKRQGLSRFQSTILLIRRILRFNFLFPRKKGNVFEGFGYYDRPLLITYSRSGTNWLRYFIEKVSGQPTPGQDRLVSGGNYIIDRAHAGFLNAEKYSSIFMILRNYKECLVRHHGLKKIRQFSSIEDYLKNEVLNQPPSWYINNLIAFNEFKGKKMLIYYEELISFPEKKLSELGDFLNLDKQAVVEFLSNIEDHKKGSVLAYTKVSHKSDTSGDPTKLNFHSKALTQDELSDFDSYYEKHFPSLFKKYLYPYAGENIRRN
jgi:hypothetical protein